MDYKKTSITLVVSSLFLCFSCATPKVATQENPVVDVIGPVIEQETNEIGLAGEAQVFAVVVTDNVGVVKVVLSYRFAAEEKFVTNTMVLVGEDKYQTTVPSKPTHSTIEYFISATDESGLEVFRGSPAAPLTRNLKVRVSALDQNVPPSLYTESKLNTPLLAYYVH